jgi:hypothetical protein
MNMVFEWIPALAIIVIGVIFCFRMLKRGLGTLEKTRLRHYEDIRAKEQQLLDDTKNISRSEHFRLAHAAITDLLHLEGDRAGFSLGTQGQTLLLNTPEGIWRITLDMRERTLHHTRKVLHSKERWVLSGFGREEKFADLAALMRNLTACLRGEKSIETPPAALPQPMRNCARAPFSNRKVTSEKFP